jgi:hypothetical protein
VAAQDAALVEDPAARGGMVALERDEQFGDRVAVDGVLGAVTRQTLERSAETNDWHGAGY